MFFFSKTIFEICCVSHVAVCYYVYIFSTLIDMSKVDAMQQMASVERGLKPLEHYAPEPERFAIETS